MTASNTTASTRLCEERLSICLEAGVPERRASELAAEDARRCAEGRPCICVDVKREEAKR